MCTSSPVWSLWRLRITAEPDPGTLSRILHQFQNLNVLPRKVLAELSTAEQVHVELDVTGLPEETVRRITSRLRELPSVLQANCGRL